MGPTQVPWLNPLGPLYLPSTCRGLGQRHSIPFCLLDQEFWLYLGYCLGLRFDIDVSFYPACGNFSAADEFTSTTLSGIRFLCSTICSFAPMEGGSLLGPVPTSFFRTGVGSGLLCAGFDSDLHHATTQSGTSSAKGYALKVAKDRKMAAHSAGCRAVRVSFIPLVLESGVLKRSQRIRCLVGKRLGSGHSPSNSVVIVLRITCWIAMFNTMISMAT